MWVVCAQDDSRRMDDCASGNASHYDQNEETREREKQTDNLTLFRKHQINEKISQRCLCLFQHFLNKAVATTRTFVDVKEETRTRIARLKEWRVKKKRRSKQEQDQDAKQEEVEIRTRPTTRNINLGYENPKRRRRNE